MTDPRPKRREPATSQREALPDDGRRYELEEVMKMIRFAREVIKKAAWAYAAYGVYFLANLVANAIVS